MSGMRRHGAARVAAACGVIGAAAGAVLAMRAWQVVARHEARLNDYDTALSVLGRPEDAPEVPRPACTR